MRRSSKSVSVCVRVCACTCMCVSVSECKGCCFDVVGRAVVGDDSCGAARCSVMLSCCVVLCRGVEVSALCRSCVVCGATQHARASLLPRRTLPCWGRRNYGEVGDKSKTVVAHVSLHVSVVSRETCTKLLYFASAGVDTASVQKEARQICSAAVKYDTNGLMYQLI